MIYLKQSTASQEVALGPFVDSTDGNTAEVALTIANTDIKIFKAGATAGVAKNSGGATHDAEGMYVAVFDATDTNTLGSGTIIVRVAGALVARHDFCVLAANVYDALIGGGDLLQVDVTQLLNTAWLTPGTAGTPDVNVKQWNGLTTVALPLVPTTAGRTLDVSVGGEAGVDWANVGSPTTALNLSGTTIATTQKVDVETIKTNPVANAGTVTFPTNATLASTTNITAGTITTVGTLTTYTGNTPQTGDAYARLGAPAGASVSADMAAVKVDTAAVKVKTDFLPSATAGAAGGVFIAGSNAATSITTALTANIIGNVTGNLSGSVGSVTGNVTGSVGSVASGGITSASFAASAIDAAAIATDAIGALELAAGAASEIASAVRTELTTELGRIDAAVSTRATQASVDTIDGIVDSILVDTAEIGAAGAGLTALASAANLATVAGYIDTEIGTIITNLATLAGYVDTEVAAIKAVTDKLDNTLTNTSDGYIFSSIALQAVWDEPIVGHLVSGTTGAALNAAGSAGDPWSTPLPGAYGAGTAGYKLSAVNGTVAKLDTMLEVTSDAFTYTPDALQFAPTGGGGGLDAAGVRAAIGLGSANLDTQLSGISSKTTNLPSDPADASDIAGAFSTVNTTLGTIAGYLDTEIAAIKAKTDNLPASPAATGDIPSAGAIADAVWDEATSGHTSGGTFGKALDDADDRGARTVIRATVGSGSTTTSIVTSAFSPAGAAADQFRGRIVIWDNDTATVELRGQATDITASSNNATPTLTVTALTTAPSSGDSFSVV